MTRIAVLASGRGSNFIAIANAIHQGRLSAQIKILHCNRSKALVLEEARKRGIPIDMNFPLNPKNLIDAGAQWVVCAGYDQIIPASFLKFFDSGLGYYRVVNIHPSLLPELPGLHSYRKAFEKKLNRTGVTVHLVDEQLDHGPILAQESFDIMPNDRLEDIDAKGLAIEHRLYADTLQWVLAEKFKLTSGGKIVRAN